MTRMTAAARTMYWEDLAIAIKDGREVTEREIDACAQTMAQGVQENYIMMGESEEVAMREAEEELERVTMTLLDIATTPR